MPTLKLKEPTTLEAVSELLQSRLPGRFEAEIKSDRLRLVESKAKGCIVSLREKEGESTCFVVGVMPSMALRAGVLVATMGLLSLIASLVLGEFNLLVGGAAPLAIAFVSMHLPSRPLVAAVSAVLESELALSSRPKTQSTRWWLIAGAGVLVVVVALALLWRPAPRPAPVPTPDVATVEHPPDPAGLFPRPAEVDPANEYSVISHSLGRVEFLHPDLKQGEVVPGGTVLVRLDGEDFALSLERSQAALTIRRAELEGLEAEESVVREVYASQQHQLAEESNERHRSVLRLETERTQRELRGINTRRQLLESEIASLERQLDQSTIDLERTAISLPVDIRVDAVLVELDEFVSAGTVLFEATEVD